MPIRCRIASLLLLLGFALAAPASAGEAKSLVLRGRVTDAAGAPLDKARVFAEGTHRASVPVDEAGQFELTLPLETSDLARRPVAVRVHAEQRGWRTELPGGDAELGIELRLLPDEGGVARCEVRSNHAGVNAAIVRALAAPGDAPGIAIVKFVATRGELISSPPAIDLRVVDRVVLPAVEVATAPAAESPVVTSEPQKKDAAREKPPKKKKDDAKAKEPSRNAADGERVEEKSSGKKSKREPERAEPPAANATGAPTAITPTPVVAPPSPKDAERELAEARRRAEKERSLAHEAAKRLREEAKNRDRMQRRTLAEEKARAADEQRSRGSAEDELLSGRDTEEKRREIPAPPLTAARDTVKVRPPRPLPEPPAVAAPAPSRASTPTTTRPVAPAPTPTSAPATTRPAAPTPTRASAPATTGPATPAPARAPALTEQRDQKVQAPRLTAPRDTVRVRPPPVPRPESGPRARARPFVIRTGGTQPSTPAAAGDSCSCLIEGTIEVDSDRPLPDRERVAISLVWYPSIGDTIELFMGSPRSFKLPPAPCGAQRLRLISLGSTRYDVISREAMAGFRCERGVRYPFRVILKPR